MGEEVSRISLPVNQVLKLLLEGPRAGRPPPLPFLPGNSFPAFPCSQKVHEVL